MPRERFADGLCVHVGIAVHVAADPGAEAQNLRQFYRVRIGPIEFLEGRGDLFAKERHDLIEHFGNEKQHMLALIGNRESLARVLGRLPTRGDLRAHAIPDRAHFRCRGVEPQAAQQELRNFLPLAQQGPARRLRGMRRQHRFDPQLQQQAMQLRQGDTACFELAQRLLHPARLFCTLIHVFATATNPMHLLRHVHHLEPGRERTHQIARAFSGNAADDLQRGHDATRLAFTPRNGGLAALLDEFEQGISALFADHLANERTQHVHVFAQGGVFEGKEEILASHGRQERLAVSDWRLGGQQRDRPSSTRVRPPVAIAIRYGLPQ